MKEETLQKYRDWIFRRSAYTMALSIIGIDQQTVAPAGGSEYRDTRSAFLAGELFEIDTDPEIIGILKEIAADETADPDDHRAAQLYAKQAENLVCIPKDEYVAYQNLLNEAYNIWLKAKQANDFSIFAPTLKKIIESSRRSYEYRKSSRPVYEQMLDDYEPGMTTEAYDAFFDQLKKRLVPLIHRVVKAKQIRSDFIFQNYPVEEQKKFMDDLLKYLHFDPEWGYQNETEHPFTAWICENDCRTTTKYLPDNVISAILSTVHEVGHAYYEHDCSPKYDGMILSEGISSGMHESQSRLCENYLGRSRAFWEYNYPVLQKYFPEQLGSVTLDEFVNAINVSEPSLVRTEADELTYPMHILIRYEIEKGLFDGSIPTDHLDEVWNEMYRKYLGIEVPDARSGILQDVHWANGSFGYFPTYALGSAYAAQFMHAMRKDMDPDEAMRSGHYEKCMNWLKEHIHQYGCRYSADEVMRMATGEPFNVGYYLDYLEDKYSRLYHLEGEE